MEGQFPVTREELYHIQMDVKHVQVIQTNHADRLLRLEKRQADDAALKSVWNSPFPSVLGGTPQQGPIHTASTEVFDLGDEQGQNLLGSLQLETDEEPVRRGASRANSVRFDVSAIQGPSWTQPPRSSGELGLVRPNSGFGSHPMIERSLSHKSDGRHSSAGHSVRSIHSAHSGRTSSLGLDTNFVIGDQEGDSPLDIPAPPPGLLLLGTVPSIIRCWLNKNFSHSTLLYAVVCTGSQKSHLDMSLVEELGLLEHIQKNSTGNYNIRLPVYLPEAVITQPMSRSSSPAPQLPTMTANFEVIRVNQCSGTDYKRAIRIFLGSDALRTHNADILFSQNLMTLYGGDRIKISVPFVRPEDDKLFKYLCTANITPMKVELKATAPLFAPFEQKLRNTTDGVRVSGNNPSGQDNVLPSTAHGHEHAEAQQQQRVVQDLLHTESSNLATLPDALSQNTDHIAQDGFNGSNFINHGGFDVVMEPDRRDPSTSIWGSWRTGGIPDNGGDAHRDSLSISGYSRAGRGERSMKVLKPFKAVQPGRSSSTARTSAAYEPPPRHSSGESRHKGQAGATECNVPVRWESKRTVSDEKPHRELRPLMNVSRSNPIGGASAFAWMTSSNPKATPTVAD